MQLNSLDINIYSHFLQIINRYMELEKCEEEEKVNTARNVKKRGQGDGVLNPKGYF